MTTATKREKLQEYIKTADDEKVKAIFTLVENDIDKKLEWWENEAFLDDLDERSKRYKEGIDKGIIFEEAVGKYRELSKEQIV